MTTGGPGVDMVAALGSLCHRATSDCLLSLPVGATTGRAVTSPRSHEDPAGNSLAWSVSPPWAPHLRVEHQLHLAHSAQPHTVPSGLYT